MKAFKLHPRIPQDVTAWCRPCRYNMPVMLLSALVMMMLWLNSVSAQVLPQQSNSGVLVDTGGAGDSTPIAIESTPADDEQIRQRLTRILSEIESLNQLHVSVSNSVIELTGQVDSVEQSVEAEALAKGLEGVVKVANQIEVSRAVSDRVRTTWDRVRKLATGATSSAPILVLSLLVVALFWYLGGWISQKTALWRTVAPNMFIATILASIIRLLVVICGVLVALYLMDATAIISTVLGAAGIVGLALGFAVRDTVENFIASILLSLRQPFRMNDFVQIEQYAGSVARLTGRATILISADGNQIRIPNSVVFKSVITNFTRHPQRRFEFTLPVDESEDLVRARKVAFNAVSGVEGVMSTPPVQVHIQTLGEAVIQLRIYGWVDQRSHELTKVQTASAVAVKSMFNANEIVMPQSVHTLRVLDSSNERVGKDSQPPSDQIPLRGERSRDVGAARGQSISTTDALSTEIDSDENAAVELQLAEEQEGQPNLLHEGSRE